MTPLGEGEEQVRQWEEEVSHEEDEVRLKEMEEQLLLEEKDVPHGGGRNFSLGRKEGLQRPERRLP